MLAEDTARWVAYLRALESERGDALFRDPYARELAGDRGREIAETMPHLPWLREDGMSQNLAVSTRVFDELISAAAVDADAVLNLGAGLDARPYRLSLPRELVWYEVDSAELLDLKAQRLANETPSCHVERVALDLRERDARHALMRRVYEHSRVIVVTEGLLMYLDEPLVAALASELRGRWILTSVASSALSAQMKHWGAALGESRWRFAPKQGLDFFRAYGWRPIAQRSFLREAERLGRNGLRYPRLTRAFSRFRPEPLTYAMLMRG
jgi:methyltransferase (TIGR00027 family)